MESWNVTVTATSVSGGVPNGNLTQLYPSWVVAGASTPISPRGGPLLSPMDGRVGQLAIQTDQTNGGTIELWDICGFDAQADVSSATTITNAQLLTLKTAKKAKLLWSQTFAAGSGGDVIPFPALAFNFMRGLAARFGNSGPTGTVTLNFIAEGGYAIRDVCPTGYTP